MHELGYDVFTLPKVHAAEQRVLLEGKLKKAEVKEEARKAGQQGNSLEKHRMKRASKKRAAKRFKENMDDRKTPSFAKEVG